MDHPREPAAFDPSDVKTLIVGDNAFERRLVHDLLITLGVREIIQADDAVAAFAQMNLRRPRLVIVDAEMRPFSGFMLAREIRGAPGAMKSIPLILFTSETSPDFAQAGREAGAHEVIAKPVSAEAMRRCLQLAMTVPRDFSDVAAPRRRMMKPVSDEAPKRSLDAIGRAAILAAIDEARAKVGGWASTGDTTLIEGARAAIERASDAAWTGGADPAVTQALKAALRLVEVSLQGRADPHVLDVSLAAARAVLSAGAGRRAMREALAEAVAEVAESRSVG